jgi:hypothetical protein
MPNCSQRMGKIINHFIFKDPSNISWGLIFIQGILKKLIFGLDDELLLLFFLNIHSFF